MHARCVAFAYTHVSSAHAARGVSHVHCTHVLLEGMGHQAALNKMHSGPMIIYES